MEPQFLEKQKNKNPRPILKLVFYVICIILVIVSIIIVYLVRYKPSEKPSACLIETSEEKTDIIETSERESLIKEVFSSDLPQIKNSFFEINARIDMEGKYLHYTNIPDDKSIVWNGEYWLIRIEDHNKHTSDAYKYDGETFLKIPELSDQKGRLRFFWSGDYWLVNAGPNNLLKYDGEKVTLATNQIGSDILSADYNGDYWLLGGGDRNRSLYRYNHRDNSIIDLSKEIEFGSTNADTIIALGNHWIITAFYSALNVYRYNGKKIESFLKGGENKIVGSTKNNVLITDYKNLFSFDGCNLIDISKSIEKQRIKTISCTDNYCLILTNSEDDIFPGITSVETNLYLYDGKNLKSLKNLFINASDQEKIKDAQYIFMGDNNWLIRTSNSVYMYDGEVLTDISLNISNKYIGNAFWNGEYWLIAVGQKKLFKYIPGSLTMKAVEGSLIKGDDPSDKMIYLIEEGKKRPILNEYVFNEKGHKWSDVIIISHSDLEKYPLGNSIIFKDGSLLSGGGNIHIIEKGRRREIVGGEYGKIFKSLNLDPQKILKVDFDELPLIPEGVPIADYGIEEDTICTERPETDFIQYSWGKKFLDILKGEAGFTITNACFNQPEKKVIYFKAGEITKSEPGIYESKQKLFILSFDTSNNQVSQLLERSSDIYENCEINTWRDKKIEYSCGRKGCNEFYVLDIETRVNTLKKKDCGAY